MCPSTSTLLEHWAQSTSHPKLYLVQQYLWINKRFVRLVTARKHTQVPSFKNTLMCLSRILILCSWLWNWTAPSCASGRSASSALSKTRMGSQQRPARSERGKAGGRGAPWTKDWKEDLQANEVVVAVEVARNPSRGIRGKRRPPRLSKGKWPTLRPRSTKDRKRNSNPERKKTSTYEKVVTLVVVLTVTCLRREILRCCYVWIQLGLLLCQNKHKTFHHLFSNDSLAESCHKQKKTKQYSSRCSSILNFILFGKNKNRAMFLNMTQQQWVLHATKKTNETASLFSNK